LNVDNQGDGAIVAGGDVAGSVFISGSNNTVYVGGPPPSTAPAGQPLAPSPFQGEGRGEVRTSERPPTIFISYSHEDDAFVTRLIASLNQAGHSVWIDRSDIKGGADWLRAISEGITSSDAFILVATKHSINSLWVQNELVLAAKRGKLIIPVLAEDVVNDPYLIMVVGSTQGIQFHSVEYGGAVARLIAALPSAGGVAAPAQSRTKDEQLPIRTQAPLTLAHPPTSPAPTQPATPATTSSHRPARQRATPRVPRRSLWTGVSGSGSPWSPR
jgi:hypothetical protein